MGRACRIPWIRQRHDLLATPARLERRWRLGAVAQAKMTRLREHGQSDWSRASIDGFLGTKPSGGQETGPNPTDRGKLGSKRHIVADARGIPLVILVSGANGHDSKMFEKCVDAIPTIAGLPESPRKRPAKLHADKGYDFKRCRTHLRQRGIIGRIARLCIESSERLGKHRWVMERSHSWFVGFGKLRICFERQLGTHGMLLKLAAAIICACFVDRWC